MTQPRKVRLGRGELILPLGREIAAKQLFLLAVQDQIVSVIEDLQTDVYRSFCATEGADHSVINGWAGRYHFLGPDESVYPFIASCAEHTLHAWALADGHKWMRPIEGRPSLEVHPMKWASYRGLPAFETVVDEDQARSRIAPCGDLPPSAFYERLVITADGMLNYVANGRYRRVENNSPQYQVPYNIEVGRQIAYDPLNDVNADVLEHTMASIRKELQTKLLNADSDCFATIDTTEWVRSRDFDHLRWLARKVVLNESAQNISKSISTDVQGVRKALSEVGKLVFNRRRDANAKNTSAR